MSISIGAFQQSQNLVSASFEDESYNSLPESCFEGCISLQTVSFTKSILKIINRRCFKNCTKLNFKLNEGLIIIGVEAFFNCHSYMYDLPGTIEIINQSAFYGAGLQRIFTIPANIRNIYESAFSNTNIKIAKYCGKETNLPGPKSFDLSDIYVMYKYKSPTIFSCNVVGGLSQFCRIHTYIKPFKRPSKLFPILIGALCIQKSK